MPASVFLQNLLLMLLFIPKPAWVSSKEVKSVNVPGCLFGVFSIMMKFIDADRRVEG